MAAIRPSERIAAPTAGNCESLRTLSDMDLLHVMRSNGSVRSFRPDHVGDDAVVRILENARFAPSGGNKQGWHVIVLKDLAVRSEIAGLARMGWNEYAAQNAAGVRAFGADLTGHWPGPPAGMDLAVERVTERRWPFMQALEETPVLLVVCVDLTVLALVDCELDRIQIAGGASIYPFVQNILLAAREEGLAGVMTTFLVRQEPAAQAVLGLPKHIAVASLVALGVPEHQNSKLTRKPVAEFTTVDRYDGPSFG